ncbi:hypothetical protein ACKVWC_011577 [Pyricularia oryzae]
MFSTPLSNLATTPPASMRAGKLKERENSPKLRSETQYLTLCWPALLLSTCLSLLLSSDFLSAASLSLFFSPVEGTTTASPSSSSAGSSCVCERSLRPRMVTVWSSVNSMLMPFLSMPGNSPCRMYVLGVSCRSNLGVQLTMSEMRLERPRLDVVAASELLLLLASTA